MVCEESETLGLVGDPMGNLVPPMLCQAPPTAVYECCQCRAVSSKRTLQHHPLQSTNIVGVELFYPTELSAMTEFSSLAPSMW